MNKMAKLVIATATVVAVSVGGIVFFTQEKISREKSNQEVVGNEDINIDKEKLEESRRTMDKIHIKGEKKELKIKDYYKYLKLCEVAEEVAKREGIEILTEDNKGREFKEAVYGEDHIVKETSWIAEEESEKEKSENYLTAVDARVKFNEIKKDPHIVNELEMTINDLDNKGDINLNDNVKKLIKTFDNSIDTAEIEAKAKKVYKEAKKNKVAFASLARDQKLDEGNEGITSDYSCSINEKSNKREVKIKLKNKKKY